MYADVLVELKAKNIDGTFTYKIPSNLINTLKIGCRVQVPFQNRYLEGFVLDIKDNFNEQYKVKEIIKQIDEKPILNKEMLDLGLYMSKKTLCNLILCYQTMLPSALKAKNGFNINKKYLTYIKLKEEFIPSNESQKEIYNILKNNELVLKSDLTKISVSSVNTLLKKGLIEEIKDEVYRLNNTFKKVGNKVTLSEEQELAIKEINAANKFTPFLLHGVTGSGKTEVYMQVIDNVLKKGKEAIILVPEISLTPQLVETFKNRFGEKIAILHSNLSNGEKYDEWRKIEEKKVSIVIGARSAIFAPFTNLGIIIVDEEQTSTYKQENNPKYHAIDIAIYRAKKYNIPLVLGSATPSIESYTRAKAGIYKLITLSKKISDTKVNYTLVDMKDEIKNRHAIISRILEQKINECLNNNEQVILLLNRRGYSTVTTCKNCGYVHKCLACDIPLTYHKSSNTMRCHYCGYAEPILKKCPSCGSTNINSYGMGTEKLVEYIETNFPKSKVIRMDNDSTANKGSHEKIIRDFEENKYNILVGTQMISKGLNFKNVSLVGIINGDASLNMPDFRSAERTFELITQVSGRVGRYDLKGDVVIQGFNMDHYSIIKASQNDYIGFYNEEMKIRKMLKYSPYYNLSLIKIKDKDYDLVLKEANKIADYLRNKKLLDTYILGPSTGFMPKINNVYEMQIILKYKKSNEIIKELNNINEIYRNNKITIDIDINPIFL